MSQDIKKDVIGHGEEESYATRDKEIWIIRRELSQRRDEGTGREEARDDAHDNKEWRGKGCGCGRQHRRWLRFSFRMCLDHGG